MVKDPLDNGRTKEFEFPEVSFEETPEVVPLTPVVEEPPEFTPMADEKIQAALAALRSRSFSARNPHLGKMINCAVCGQRHRQTNFTIRKEETAPEVRDEKGNLVRKKVVSTTIYFDPCRQVFAYMRNGFEYFREGEDGKLVPDYRTAIDPALTPTVNQQNGAPLQKNFAKPRYNPHPSKWNLQLVERTRAVFADMGFTELKGEQAQKNMHLARTEAACQLKREAKRAKRRARKMKRKQQRRFRR